MPPSGTASLSPHVASAAVCLACVVQTQLLQSQNKEESNVLSSPWVTSTVKISEIPCKDGYPFLFTFTKNTDAYS